MQKALINLILCFLIANLANCLNDEDCKCKIQANQKVVGGDVSSSAYPWMVSLAIGEQEENDLIRKSLPDDFKVNQHICGGVILNEREILTAAHCAEPAQALSVELSVGFGSNDLVKIFENPPGRIYVESIKMNFFYNSMGNAENDIAILKLSESIKFVPGKIEPACIDLINDRSKDYGTNLILTGFGITERAILDEKTGQVLQQGKVSRYLKEMLYKDISKSEIDEFAARCHADPGFICVDNMKKGDSGCFGDSGGPLHAVENGKYKVIGLTSSSDYNVRDKDGYVYACNGKAYFTKISNYADWIKTSVDDEKNLCQTEKDNL